MSIVALAGALAVSTGCKNIPSEINLKQAAMDAGLTNITTGDGTFENYQATGYHKSLEIGFAIGLPFFGKFFEVYPVQTNEDQLAAMAGDAKKIGADAMINVQPPEEFYTGFPFLIFGVYIDTARGTGIDVK